MKDSSIDWYEIKGRYMAGEKPKRLAQMYEIDPKQLSNIIVRQGWRKQREEIRHKVAEEFVEAQRELNQKAMQFVNLVLSALINDDGTLNWEACKTMKSSVIRLCLQMAMPEKVKVREVTHTFGEGPEPWRSFTEPPGTEEETMSKTEQKFDFENYSPPAASWESPQEDGFAEPTAAMADLVTPAANPEVSKTEQKSDVENYSSPEPTILETPPPSKLAMLAHMNQMWDRIAALMAQAPRLSPPEQNRVEPPQNATTEQTYFYPPGYFDSPHLPPPLTPEQYMRNKARTIRF